MIKKCIPIGLVLFCIHTFFLFGHGKGELTIYYSNSLNGNFIGCDCKENPKAGLSKRIHYIRNNINPEKSVLIDGGDILDVYPDKKAASLIFDAYKRVGYDAVAVGDQEFTNGIEAFRGYADAYPLLCANLAVSADSGGKQILPGYKIIDRGGYSVGIFSVIDPKVFQLYDRKLRNHIELQNPEKSASNMLDKMQAEGIDFSLLMYHGYARNAEKLLSRIKGVDIALITHEQKTINAETWNDTLVVAPGKNGNTLGMLTVKTTPQGELTYDNTFHTFRFLHDPDDKAFMEHVQKYKDSLSSGIKVEK